jgi:Domain of unknown function (DUF4394)
MTKFRSTALGLLCLLLVGIAGLPATASAQGTMLLGVVRGANTIVLFNSSNPSAIVSAIPITGLAAGEVIRGIDVRPANGVLYGLATQDAITTQVRLYTINPLTGTATAVGPVVNVAFAGTFVGMSFNAVADRVRVVNTVGTNARLHPDTGALVANDTSIASAGFIDSVAYDNQLPGATQTTLYAINIGTSRLNRIGGPQGIPSPNGGVVTEIGPLGLALEGNAPSAFDWAPDGTFFAVLRVGEQTGLYTVDTATGSAAIVGVIGDGTPIIDSLAVGAAGLAITPASGIFTTQQRFDVVLLFDAQGRSIVSGSAIFDGINVTGYIVSCATLGHTASGLTTIRCGGFGGPLFGPGNHAFTVNLLLNTGEAVSATVNWNVLKSTEP